MPEFSFPYFAVIQHWNDGRVLAEALLFPEASCAGFSLTGALERLDRRVREIVEAEPSFQLYRRFPAEKPVVKQFAFKAPATKSSTWAQDLPLRFDYVQWWHPGHGCVAFFPTLSIEIFATDEKRLQDSLHAEVLHALVRSQSLGSLRELILTQQTQRVELVGCTCQIRIRSPLAQAKSRTLSENNDSVLKKIATRMTRKNQQQAFEVRGQVEALAERLTAVPAQSVLLVGPSGVGKSAVLSQLVRQRSKLGLKDRRFWQTSGSQLISGMCGFGMWQDRCEQLVSECRRRSVIVSLGSLIELMEVGKGGGNRLGVASFLRPFISRGQFQVVAECTVEQWSLIQQREPQLLDVFQRLDIVEPGPLQRKSILQKLARDAGAEELISADSLAAVERLHNRYATYSAWPGRPVRFLKNLLESHHQGGRVIEPSDVVKAFSQETGLPLFLLDDRVPLRIGEVTRSFTRRVMGQDDAVQRIVDMIAMVKTDLNREGRPIASLLFAGPTGVGKTETAKALAEVLYQDEQRLVRFDMSEYADPQQVQRLTGGSFSTEGLLTGKLREQPFTVLLLDEIEKAHPLVFDLLLQVLGEGRLTDSAGRVTDFCNAVVIMTSNLGADSFAHGQVGFGSTQQSVQNAQEHFVRKVQELVRPELFNRIDRIVTFSPLSREIVQRIADREIDKVQLREGVRFRNVQLDYDESLVERIAARGFEPRFGARPLKRAVESEVVVPLAEKLNQYTNDTRLTASLGVQQHRVRVAVKGETGTRGWGIVEGASTVSEGEFENATEAAHRASQLRRKCQALTGSGCFRELRNELYRLESQYKRQLARLRSHQDQPDIRVNPRLGQLQRLMARVNKINKGVDACEMQQLMHLYGSFATRGNSNQAELQRELDDAVMDVFLFEQQVTPTAYVLVYGPENHLVRQLVAAYWQEKETRGWSGTLYRLTAHDEQRKTPASLQACWADDERKRSVVDLHPMRWSVQGSTEPMIGLACEFSGRAAGPLLTGEDGVHRFLLEEGGTRECLVLSGNGKLRTHEPPDRITRLHRFKGWALRREYDFARGTAKDAFLNQEVRLGSSQIAAVVSSAMNLRLHKLIDKLL